MIGQKWFEMIYKNEPEADANVLKFIAEFVYHNGEAGKETIISLFTNGYCWYFSHILQSAFQRGNVCYVYDEHHFVWVDDNGVKYDINGVYHSWRPLIPEDELKDGVLEYMHVPGKNPVSTEPEIVKRMMDYIELEEQTCTQ